jgi:ribosomal protein L7/L12
MSDGTLAIALIALALALSVISIVATLRAPSARSSGKSDHRLARLERRLDALEKHTGAPPAAVPDWTEDVLDLMDDGQKIPAIKLYRQQTGVGLAEAKSAVEELALQRVAK